MPAWLFILIVLAVLIAVAIGEYFDWKNRQKRRQHLFDLSREFGLDFDKEYEPTAKLTPLFSVFNTGHDRKAENTMCGEVNLGGEVCRVQLGDYSYTVSGGGKSESPRVESLSYLAVFPPWASPSGILIRPQRFTDRLASIIGFEDITLESREFNRRYFVKSPDKRFAYDLLHARTMELLLASKPRTIELRSGVLLIHTNSRMWKPEAFEEHLGFAGAFIELWPRHLIEVRTRAAG